MAIISFEKIVGDKEAAEIPDGYCNLNWNNFFAADDELHPNTGFDNVIHSGEASAFNASGDPAGFESADREDDFDLNSGFFAAAYTDNLKVKVFGFNDGERVATEAFKLDQAQEFARFSGKFDSVDEVKFKVSGGTDADPNDGFPPTQIFAVDDLFIDF